MYVRKTPSTILVYQIYISNFFLFYFARCEKELITYLTRGLHVCLVINNGCSDPCTREGSRYTL